ncbi:hypothetical protein B0H19DRAFT_1153796 [Mycena capillaripes]|nr:hypothetical protein B0H19DRAFT_1153796 [Mycena capillaripes]
MAMCGSRENVVAKKRYAFMIIPAFVEKYVGLKNLTGKYSASIFHLPECEFSQVPGPVL